MNASSSGDSRDRLSPPHIAALLADIPGGQPNLLPTAATSTSLRVDIDLWPISDPQPGEPETLELFWDGQSLGLKSWEAPIDPAELHYRVAVERLGEGAHTLHYQVQTPNQGLTLSEPLTLTIDKTPPILAGDGALQFDAQVISGGVTYAWLEAHADQLLAQVPTWQSPSPGDLINFYWSSSPVGNEAAGSHTLVLADIGLPVEIVFQGELIRALGDGVRYASYKIQDRAGNASQRALAVQLNVAAHKPPRKLPAPQVRQATGSGSNWTLDPLRAVDGVTLAIPAEAVIHDGDRVVMQWGLPGSIGDWRGDTETTPGSREYRVPASRVAPHIGQSNVPVYYEVVEPGGSEPHLSTPSRVQVSELKGLPAVQCEHIVSGALSIAAVEAAGGRSRLSLASWPFMAAEQFVNLKLNGLDSAGQMLSLDVLVEQPVGSAGASFPAGELSSAQLRRFRLGSPLELKAWVSFDAKRSWKAFTTASATLRA